MLLTQTTWEENNPVRRQLVSPYAAFRCVAVSTQSPCFLIHHNQQDFEDDSVPVGAYLVTKPEDVLEVVAQLEAERSHVYVIQTRPEADERCVMNAVIAIRSYCEDGVTWFSYVTVDGTITPCHSWQPRARSESPWRVEWSSKR